MSEEIELTPEVARQLFGPRRLDEEPPEPPEPPVEGTPPKNKPVSEWTPEESEAQRRSFDRTMRAKAEAEERERREQAEREEVEANKTPDQQLGDAIALDANPEVKRQRDAAFIRSIHGGEE